MTAPLAMAGADAAGAAVAGGGEAAGASAAGGGGRAAASSASSAPKSPPKTAPATRASGGRSGGGGKGKGPALSLPGGGGKKHSGGGSRRPHGRQVLVAEFVGCFVILALSPLTDKHKADSPASLLKRGSAICALFLILGLVSTGGRSASKLATYFGGLVLVVLLVSERDVFAVIAARFAGGTGPAGPADDSAGGGGADADFGTGSGPGPGAEAPTTGASPGRAVVNSWFPWMGGGV